MPSDAQRFLDTISQYDYFSRGAMDVEEHCVWLALAFVLDGIPGPPSPKAIYDLLIRLADNLSSEEDLPPVQRSQFGAGVDFDEAVHPGGQFTLLLPATAVMVFDHYVVALGELLGKRPDCEPVQAGYWIEPTWTFTSTLVDGFYRSVGELIHRVDGPLRQRMGYSTLEVLRMGILDSHGDPEVVLDAHANAVEDLCQKVSRAINAQAYREAITQQERLFSLFLGQALEMHGRATPRLFVDRVAEAQALDQTLRMDRDVSLWDRLTAWRKGRNRVIHAPDPSIFKMPRANVDVDEFARETAQAGLHLMSELRAWGIEARARSLDMALPRPNPSGSGH